MVPVRVEGAGPIGSTVLLESDPRREVTSGVKIVDALLRASGDGGLQLLLSNHSGFTKKLEEGVVLGKATEVDVVEEDVTRAGAEADMEQTDPICLLQQKVPVNSFVGLAEDCQRMLVISFGYSKSEAGRILEALHFEEYPLAKCKKVEESCPALLRVGDPNYWVGNNTVPCVTLNHRGLLGTFDTRCHGLPLALHKFLSMAVELMISMSYIYKYEISELKSSMRFSRSTSLIWFH